MYGLNLRFSIYIIKIQRNYQHNPHIYINLCNGGVKAITGYHSNEFSTVA
jgi:hypothetical protein